jgi:hypothetical protein
MRPGWRDGGADHLHHAMPRGTKDVDLSGHSAFSRDSYAATDPEHRAYYNDKQH